MIKLFFALQLLCLVLFGCNNDAKTTSGVRNESGLFLQEGTQDDNVKSLRTSKKDDTFSLNNKTYESTIILSPNKELPKVKSEMGDLYFDNTIELIISHNGATHFQRRFSKKDFSSVVDDSFLNKAILEGMVHNKHHSSAMAYTVSICFPQTDLCIPVTITIGKDGNYSIRKDEQLEEVYQSFAN